MRTRRSRTEEGEEVGPGEAGAGEKARDSRASSSSGKKRKSSSSSRGADAATGERDAAGRSAKRKKSRSSSGAAGKSASRKSRSSSGKEGASSSSGRSKKAKKKKHSQKERPARAEADASAGDNDAGDVASEPEPEPVAVAAPSTAIVLAEPAPAPAPSAPASSLAAAAEPPASPPMDRASQSQRATNVIKAAKKASRAMTKRNRGSGRGQLVRRIEDIPQRQSLTIKEIIRCAQEAERLDNKKRPKAAQSMNAVVDQAEQEVAGGKGATGAGDGAKGADGGAAAPVAAGGAGEGANPDASKSGGGGGSDGAGAAGGGGGLFQSAGQGAGPPSGKDGAIAPQVQVVDGQIVINRESLSRKAQVEPLMRPERRVEETGNKLSAFSYSGYLTPEKWTKVDTETFYEALEQFGTDFGLIQKLFPKRERKQIKSKFRREEKSNPNRIEEALRKHNSSVCVNSLKIMLDKLKNAEAAEGN